MIRSTVKFYGVLLCCRISEIEPKYYADGEDAYAMKRDLVSFASQNIARPDSSSCHEIKSSVHEVDRKDKKD
jgi:peptide alpha-N-acetyltransferase